VLPKLASQVFGALTYVTAFCNIAVAPLTGEAQPARANFPNSSAALPEPCETSLWCVSQLTQQAKISTNFQSFAEIFAFAGFVSGLKKCSPKAAFFSV